MIIQNDVREVVSTGIGDTTGMTINKDIENHIIKIVTEHSYRNPLESMVRELTSNAVDSHIESGQEDPVIVSLQKNANDKWEFSVQDFGLGLNHEEFEKYIMGIGESTKRNNPNVLGGWGAGSACWLAYQSSCTYICVKDGVERKYLIFKGQERPENLPIHEKPTEQRNGVKFAIELLTTYGEYGRCVDAIKKQLAYLPNIYFNIPDFDNKYKIFRNELFQWNTLEPSNLLHISLKNIYYPIDFSAINVSVVNLPIAIRIDDYEVLQPTFNREELKYNEASKQLIREKIAQVVDWFINRYNNCVESIKLENLVKNFTKINPHNSKSVEIEGKSFGISSLEKFGTLKFSEPAIEGVSILKPSVIYSNYNFLLTGFRIVGCINKYRNWQNKHWIDANNPAYRIIENQYDHIILVDGKPTGLNRDFYGDTLSNTLFVAPDNQSKQKDLNWYYQFLRLKDIPKQSWRKAIQEWQSVVKAFTDKFEPASKYPITDEWRAKQKANRAINTNIKKTYVKTEEVNLREVIKGINKTHVLAPGKIAETTSLDNNQLTIYGLPEDKDKLGDLRWFAKVYCLAQRDIERVENLQLNNWITYEKFMDGDTKEFKDACLKIKYTRYYDKLYNDIAVDFMCFIDPWFNQFKQSARSFVYRYNYIGNKENFVSRNMMPIARKKGWWDTELDRNFEIADTILETKDLSFLKYISINKEKGMELAKEIYFGRLKQKKDEILNNDNWVVPDRM